MSILSMVYSHDDIFDAVKMESTRFAENETTAQGQPLFDAIVFDEQYLDQFRPLFFEAQAYVTPVLMAYLIDDNSVQYFEGRDYSTERDYIFVLKFNSDVKKLLSQALDTTIKNTLVYYILWKWYLIRYQPAVQIYQNLSYISLSQIKSILSECSGSDVFVRKGHLFN